MESTTAATPPGGTKLFIGGVSWTTTDEAFRQYFEKFGPLEDSVLMRTAEGKMRGFGFVTYTTKEDANKVLAAKDELELDNRKMEPKPAVPREQQQTDRDRAEENRLKIESGEQKVKKIFIGGITLDTTKEDFEQHFAQFGTITDAIVMSERGTGRSRGFGFVLFDSEEAVDSAMDHPQHVIRERKVEIKRAIPKEQSRGRHKSHSGGRQGYDHHYRGYDNRRGGPHHGGNRGYPQQGYNGYQPGYGHGQYYSGQQGYGGYGRGGYGPDPRYGGYGGYPQQGEDPYYGGRAQYPPYRDDADGRSYPQYGGYEEGYGPGPQYGGEYANQGNGQYGGYQGHSPYQGHAQGHPGYEGHGSGNGYPGYQTQGRNNLGPEGQAQGSGTGETNFAAQSGFTGGNASPQHPGAYTNAGPGNQANTRGEGRPSRAYHQYPGRAMEG